MLRCASSPHLLTTLLPLCACLPSHSPTLNVNAALHLIPSPADNTAAPGTPCAGLHAFLTPTLKRNAGCAPGFGSYVQPPMPGHPYHPPRSCPTWVKSSTGHVTKGVLRTTQANGKTPKAVSLEAWYKTKPGFCARSYYPMKSCQGDLSGSSSGYCQCFACPTGEHVTFMPQIRRSEQDLVCRDLDLVHVDLDLVCFDSDLVYCDQDLA